MEKEASADRAALAWLRKLRRHRRDYDALLAAYPASLSERPLGVCFYLAGNSKRGLTDDCVNDPHPKGGADGSEPT